MRLRQSPRSPIRSPYRSALDIALSGAVVIDTDVASYATAVTTAGGTLPPSHLTALNSNIAALKASGAWALIKEMWIPMGAAGDLTTAKVKFKSGTATPSVTMPNVVSGDYTIALGIDGGTTATNKSVNTDFSPAVNGSLVNTAWGFNAYMTRRVTNSSAVAMGTISGTNAYIQFTSGQSSIGGVQPTNGLANTPRLVGAQQTGGNAYLYAGGYVMAQAANGAPGALPAGGMSVLSVNGAFYGNGATSGYIINAPMTAAQLRSVQTFFDNVCLAIGRSAFSQTLVGLGDSYLANPPTGPSDNAHDYLALVGTAKGWGYDLQGIGGTTWSSKTAGNVIGDIWPKMMPTMSKHVLFAFGINDANTSQTPAQVTTGMQSVFDALAVIGYPPAYLAIGTLYPWTGLPSQSNAAAIAQAERDVATAYGVNMVDFFVGSTNGVTAVETGIHKTDAGHVLLGNDATTAFNSWSW